MINGYGKYFANSQTDYFNNGATFDEICQVYFFDTEIKIIFLKAIIQAENHIKYVTAYRFSELAKDEPFPYLNVKYYNPNNILYVSKVIANFSKIINKHNHPKTPSYNNPIKHYIKKHGNVPIWVVIEYFDLGSLYIFIRNLPTSTNNNIAKSMLSFMADNTSVDNPFTPEILLSFVDNMRQVRNVCAHGNRLINFKTKQDIKYYKDIFEKIPPNQRRERRSVYHIYLVLQCFLSKTQYRILHNTLLKRIKYLDKQLHSISINAILMDLGFPEDWHLNTTAMKQ